MFFILLKLIRSYNFFVGSERGSVAENLNTNGSPTESKSVNKQDVAKMENIETLKKEFEELKTKFPHFLEGQFDNYMDY